MCFICVQPLVISCMISFTIFWGNNPPQPFALLCIWPLHSFNHSSHHFPLFTFLYLLWSKLLKCWMCPDLSCIALVRIAFPVGNIGLSSHGNGSPRKAACSIGSHIQINCRIVAGTIPHLPRLIHWYGKPTLSVRIRPELRVAIGVCGFSWHVALLELSRSDARNNI